MGLFQIIKRRWTSRTTLPQIADEIGDRCLESVWQRVQHQVAKLAPAEARGYIRARGIAVVEPQLAWAAEQHEVLEHLRPHLYALAVESLIRRVQDRARNRAGQRHLRRVA
ncbi:MAG: hypothetical protein ABI614_02635 [Planctomycetota bacterium]